MEILAPTAGSAQTLGGPHLCNGAKPSPDRGGWRPPRHPDKASDENCPDQSAPRDPSPPISSVLQKATHLDTSNLKFVTAACTQNRRAREQDDVSHNLEKEQSAGAHPGMAETPGLLQRWSQNLSSQLCSRSESEPGTRTVVPGPVGGIGHEESLTLGCLLLLGGTRDMEVVHRLDLQALSVVGAPIFPPVTWLCHSTYFVSLLERCTHESRKALELWLAPRK